jgi:ribosomal protein S17
VLCVAGYRAATRGKGDPAAREGASKMGMRRVTGTVKQTTEKGLVVVGRETGQKDKEWAFVLDAGTRIEAGGKSATDLREGDAVTVTYTNRDGKIVAQSIKVNAP